MTDARRVGVSSGAAAAAVLLLLVMVGAGAAYLRRDRRADAPGSTATAPAATGSAATPSSSTADAAVQTAKIVSNEKGYEPDTISVRAGVPVKLTFIRTTDKTCGTEVIFPSLKLRRDLPLNQPVVVELTPEKTGEIAFACGMNMFTGAVVVR